ncbi:GNAT family N-acetyltransferase [Bacillus cereus group sp. TH177-1LC]|uniref:GNAT family N-acetyltransferase n=1 Tax=Bacillus cereus group sp. TH177-1LC TaxID=3018055 RepID=UPI0022E17240|nr:GNAT family N-acetyltransferase [Bacillus cereus group sp. TH177-1LC]MDA1642220.1 GNAT family N-acetyltransferase [Bacillus cereus group sp. TH177-1LC]
MIVLETERLVLRWFDIKDAPFILKLVNDPAWIQYIGDKRIKNLEDAKKYILNGPIDMYNKMGFGLYLVERKEDFTSLGMCGLIKRDSLEDVDIGFAFLEEFRSKGYGYESASAAIEYGVQKLGLKRIVAITTIDNIHSGKLLEKVGLKFEEIISDSGEDLKLFGYNAY